MAASRVLINPSVRGECAGLVQEIAYRMRLRKHFCPEIEN